MSDAAKAPMRVTIDLSDEDSPNGGPFAWPSSIFEDDDDVVIQLRECEVRMSFSHFIEFQEALNRFAFHDMRRIIDVGDEDHVPGAEHQHLRKLVQDLKSGDPFDGVDVPQALVDRIRWRLSLKTNPDKWVTQEYALLEARGRAAELQNEVEALEKRLRPRPDKEDAIRAENDRLRAILQELLDGRIDGQEVPVAIAQRVRWRMNLKADVKVWVSNAFALQEAEQRNVELEQQIAKLEEQLGAARQKSKAKRTPK